MLQGVLRKVQRTSQMSSNGSWRHGKPDSWMQSQAAHFCSTGQQRNPLLHPPPVSGSSCPCCSDPASENVAAPAPLLGSSSSQPKQSRCFSRSDLGRNMGNDGIVCDNVFLESTPGCSLQRQHTIHGISRSESQQHQCQCVPHALKSHNQRRWARIAWY